MKKLLLSVIAVLAMISSFAALKTATTGNWNPTAGSNTSFALAATTVSDSIKVPSGVTVTVTGVVTCGALYVEAGGAIIYSSSSSRQILVVAGTAGNAGTVTIDGSLTTANSSSQFISWNGPSLSFGAASTFTFVGTTSGGDGGFHYTGTTATTIFGNGKTVGPLQVTAAGGTVNLSGNIDFRGQGTGGPCITLATSTSNLVVPTGTTLTLSANNVTTTDFSITSGGKITLNGTAVLDNKAGTTGTIAGAGAITLNGTSKYIHNHAGLTLIGTGGTTVVYNTGTTCEVRGAIAAGTFAGLTSQNFQNFIWNATSQAGNVNINGASFNVAGTFDIQTTGNVAARALRLTGNTTGQIVNITGDLKVSGLNGIAVLDLASGTGNPTVNVTGNVSIGGNSFASTLTSTAGASTLKLKGNWTNGTNGVFTNASTTIEFNSSTSNQTITKTGGETFNNLVINNSFGGTGVTLANSVTVNTLLTLTSGKIATGANSITVAAAAGLVTGGSTNYVNGTLVRAVAAGASGPIAFPIGGATAYAPLSLTFAAGTAAGNVTASTTVPGAPPAVGAIPTGSGISQTNYINRNWTLAFSAATNYTASFTYINPADITGSPTLTALRVGLNNGGTWSNPTGSSVSPTATTAAGITTGGIFSLGDAAIVITPTINPSTNTFTAFTTTYGTVSSVQTVAVTGTDLSADIAVSAGTGFEVSNGGAFGSSTSFTQSGGNASGTLSVRLAANAAVTGSYNSATVATLTSTGAATRTYTTSASGNAVTAANLTVTGVTANNKSYDGLTAAALSGTAAYAGLQNGESFSVTGTPSANFNTPAVGNAKPVTIIGYTAPTSNYTVSQPSSSANIIAAALTITGITANNKSYDGNNTATLSGTPAYVGLQNGESFSVTGTATATFNNASVGNNKPVTVTGYTAPTGNYSVSQPAGLTADIVAIGQGTADFRSKANGNFSATSGVWEYDLGGGNWTNATQAPLSTNSVSITHNITLDQDYTVGTGKTFVLGSGGTFTVNSTRTFDVTATGTANFAGQSVTFKSDASGTASLGQVLGTLSNATNVTVERFIPDNGFRSWRLLSVPTFGNGQTIRQAWQEGTANPLPFQDNLPGFGTQITGVGSSVVAQAAGFDSVAATASLLRWTGTAWAGITNTNTAIANFPAYFLFIRGDRTKGVTTTNNNSSSTTLRTNGTVYTGDQVNNIGTNAFALVPNLYPSAINFTGLTRTGGVSNLFYTWDSKKISGNSLGVYQTFSGTNSFNCMISGGSYTFGAPNTTIESGQGFFVQSTTAGTITLKETAKISGTNGSLGFRPSATPARIDTRLYNSNDEMLDANTVVFDAAYDKAVDGDDAPKYGNPGANFAIETQSKLLAIEGTQPVQDKDVIRFRMWNLQQQNYKLEIAAIKMNATDLTAVLKDSYLKTTTVIDLSATTTINFSVDGNAGSSDANRFSIVFAKAKAVQIIDTKQGYTIAPNPVENSVMNLQFNNQPVGKYKVRMLAAGGQSVMAKSLTHTGGNATQSISLPATIGNGTYTVVIIAADNSSTTKTILVNRK